MNFFTENLRTLRKESGLLQRELADKLHLTKNAVSFVQIKILLHGSEKNCTGGRGDVNAFFKYNAYNAILYRISKTK